MRENQLGHDPRADGGIRNEKLSRKALVTGGVSGIGKAVTHRLRRDGLSVVTMDVNEEADVTVDVSDSRAVTEALGCLSDVDIVVNSAGVVGPQKPLWEITDSEWTRTISVNLNGIFNVCRSVAPQMIEQGWGRIVNVASIAGKDGNPKLSAYSASKAAVIGLTKSLGKEMAKSGVLVNAVAPAVIATSMNASTSPEVMQYMTELIPMGRVGEAREVAELIAWLTSDSCSFSTGAVYDITGGRATY